MILLDEKAEGVYDDVSSIISYLTGSVQAAALPDDVDDVDFAGNMKNKPGIPTVKREKEAYKSLTRHVVMVRVGLNIVTAHVCRQ